MTTNETITLDPRLLIDSVGGFPSPDQGTLQSGLAGLFIVGAIYLYGAVYHVYKKYYFPSLEDLITFFEDTPSSPYLYSFFGSIPYLGIMLYSTTIANDNLGVTTLVGSEAVNFLLIMAIIQYYSTEDYIFDSWIFMKDSFCYAINLILLCVFFAWPTFLWYMALIWFLYWLSYIFVFQRPGGWLKDKIYGLLGLLAEKDEFSCEENKKWVRRRFSLSDLKKEGFVDIEDENLRKTISRQEGALKIQLKNQAKKLEVSQFGRDILIQFSLLFQKK